MPAFLPADEARPRSTRGGEGAAAAASATKAAAKAAKAMTPMTPLATPTRRSFALRVLVWALAAGLLALNNVVDLHPGRSPSPPPLAALLYSSSRESKVDGETGHPILSRPSDSHDDDHDDDESADVLTVGVAVTVTGCDASYYTLDGAAVLRHSFLRHHHTNNGSSSSSSSSSWRPRYRYRFYAIYHPAAAGCVQPLADAGYELLERPTPVNVSLIRGEYLRRVIPTAGCCGDKELIKFEALLLTQHAAVIVMDADMIVLKPLDDVIDLLLGNSNGNNHKSLAELAAHHLQKQEGNNDTDTAAAPSEAAASAAASGDIWLLYVNDYAMAKPPYLATPSQGGFAVLKPNRTIYRDIQNIVLEGDFHHSLGWGSATGIFWGSMTYQGLLPYYYQILNPGRALALDWCLHDNMNSPSTGWVTVDENTYENGTSHRVERCHAPGCQDCRDAPFADLYTVHYTLCDKPWECAPRGGNNPKTLLCREMHKAWFQLRSEMERSWGRSGRGGDTSLLKASKDNATIATAATTTTTATTADWMHGYCSKYGEGGYEPIRQPYGGSS